ncbi:J domain-containing protein [Candidatus Woesearchaeota archaeon]|nr:J domain-containing protein [Candidatus Woesearchaeota archaeon]
MQQDYYAILEVRKNSSPKEIKRAYRRLARQFHPDLNHSSDNKAFLQISEAYEVLGDPEKRKLYDTQRNVMQENVFPTTTDLLNPHEKISLSARRYKYKLESIAILLTGFIPAVGVGYHYGYNHAPMKGLFTHIMEHDYRTMPKWLEPCGDSVPCRETSGLVGIESSLELLLIGSIVYFCARSAFDYGKKLHKQYATRDAENKDLQNRVHEQD